MLSLSSVSAQEWTSEQKDVWTGVEKYWAAATSGDAQAFLAYIDESYKGWDNSGLVPMNKANTGKWIEYGSKTRKVLVYTITPLAIWVNGNFAYVHYSYNEVDKNTETGKTSDNSGIWTDILMKKDGKWLLIGDHGGRTSKE
jgi:ketosteroid isomerase-like protein